LLLFKSMHGNDDCDVLINCVGAILSTDKKAGSHGVARPFVAKCGKFILAPNIMFIKTNNNKK